MSIFGSVTIESLSEKLTCSQVFELTNKLSSLVQEKTTMAKAQSELAKLETEKINKEISLAKLVSLNKEIELAKLETINKEIILAKLIEPIKIRELEIELAKVQANKEIELAKIQTNKEFALANIRKEIKQEEQDMPTAKRVRLD